MSSSLVRRSGGREGGRGGRRGRLSPLRTVVAVAVVLATTTTTWIATCSALALPSSLSSGSPRSPTPLSGRPTSRSGWRLHSSLSTRGGAGKSGADADADAAAARRGTMATAAAVSACACAALLLWEAASVAALPGGSARAALSTTLHRRGQAVSASAATALRPLFTASFWSAVAPYASIALKLSPMPTILAVVRRGDVGALPLLPYSSMAALTFVLVSYGALVRDPKIFITHGIGHLLSLFYCLAFLRACRPHSNGNTVSYSLPGTPQQHKLAFLSIASITLLTMSIWGRAATAYVGYGSAFLSMVMYAGPLSVLKRTIQTRNANAIPLPYAITSLFNSIAWTVYGYFVRDNDISVWLPGCVGLLSATTQIGLKIVFNKKKVIFERASIRAVPTLTPMTFINNHTTTTTKNNKEILY